MFKIKNDNLFINYLNGITQQCNEIITLLTKLLESIILKKGNKLGSEKIINQKTISESIRENGTFGRIEEEYGIWIKMLIDIGVLKMNDDKNFIINKDSILVIQTLNTEALIMKLYKRKMNRQDLVFEWKLAESIRTHRDKAYKAIHAGRHSNLFWTSKQKNEPIKIKNNEKSPIVQKTLHTWKQVEETISKFLKDPLHTSATFWQLNRELDFLTTDWDRWFWVNELAEQRVISRKKSTTTEGKNITLFTLTSIDNASILPAKIKTSPVSIIKAA